MAKTIDLYIDQGSDFLAILPPVTRPNGSVLNLTGYTASAVMRRSFSGELAVEFTSTVTNAAQGLITLSLGNDITIDLLTIYAGIGDRWVYDVVLTDGSAKITKIFEGQVFVNPGATSNVLLPLTIPYLPEDFGGI